MTRPGGMPIRASLVGLAALAVIAGTPVAYAAPVASTAPGNETAMAATIHEFRGCLRGLAHSDRSLLKLRFGIGGRTVLTDAEVATRLSLTQAQVSDRIGVAVQRLTIVHRLGGCRTVAGTRAGAGTGATAGARASARGVTTAASSSSLGAPRTAILSPLTPHHSGGGIAVGEVLAIIGIAACALVAGREFRKVLFPQLPKH